MSGTLWATASARGAGFQVEGFSSSSPRCASACQCQPESQGQLEGPATDQRVSAISRHGRRGPSWRLVPQTHVTRSHVTPSHVTHGRRAR
eukprot:109353-Rhodomonas_salina.1